MAAARKAKKFNHKGHERARRKAEIGFNLQ